MLETNTVYASYNNNNNNKNHVAQKPIVTEKLGHNVNDEVKLVKSIDIIKDLVSSHRCFLSFSKHLILVHYGSSTRSGANLISLKEKTMMHMKY